MSNGLKATGLVIGFILFILLLGWIGQGNDFFLYKVFAPKYAKVQREVFVNTPSYILGMNQDLARYYKEWNDTEDQTHRTVIENVIKERFASYNVEDVNSPALQHFLIKTRGF